LEEIGFRLRTIRLQRQLSLREVEERSLRFAEEWGHQSYHISASWLNRLERADHELTVNKLMVLAYIYNVSPDQVLHPSRPDYAPAPLDQQSNPNATLLREGPLWEQAKYLLDTSALGQPSEETRLFAEESGPLHTPFRRAIIGKRDRILEPIIPAGSIVQIDTRHRAISSRKSWKNELQRPIYFLMTRTEYVCGWCELDQSGEWLTLVPHLLSPAPSRRWKYRQEIETLGRVTAMAVHLTPDF
jgi:transcriptional regulator with XRE-family HTH domain